MSSETVSVGDTVNLRGAAYDRMRALRVCEELGHLAPSEAWYDRNRDVLQPCRRGCGTKVKPQIDWSGHP